MSKIPRTLSRWFGLGGMSPIMPVNANEDAKTGKSAGYGARNPYNEKNLRENALILNALDIGFQSRLLKKLWVSRFIWEGEPLKGTFQGYIESSIYETGFCLACKVKDQLIIAPAKVSGWNYQYQPSEFTLVTADSDLNQLQFLASECVVIKDTNDCAVNSNTLAWIADNAYYNRIASKLADVERSVEIGLANIHVQSLISTNSYNKKSREILAEQLALKSPYIFVEQQESLTGENPNPFLDGAHVTGESLEKAWNVRHSIRQEALSYMGLGGMSRSKGQYESDGEQEIMTGDADTILQASLENRKMACKEIKEKLGFEITVRLNQTEKEEEAAENEEENPDAND